MTTIDTAEATRIFDEHRDRLHAIAYRLLGRTGDAEDVVQDSWLRWSDVDVAEVTDPEAYLVRVVTRLAIDRLRSAQARHERYTGSWLPEPLVTGPDVADEVALAATVSTAMLVLLESLSPLERAVFVLREAFGYSYAEIAAMVERSEASVRQTARRAREHVERRRVRYDTDRATRAEVTERFLAAAAGGALAELMEVLAPDVTLVSDGGGKAPAPRRPILGAEAVARALVTFAGRMPPEPRVEIAEVNGGPGIVVYSGETPAVVLTLHLSDGAVHLIHLVSAPDKLTGLRPAGRHAHPRGRGIGRG
ncbi:RNA polymerase sigma-70 factor [Actinoallomurus rhizosphaericola]|uniref:RNA polymerase sigma-70 factor n=1 Tax=Actinoallomurus rhizosphaericola TaxID=2952536 RepID=UPI0020939280|nr:RNA polymerase sigma-70 factor [Actinoallomurus rhizosphaericola]MCO5998884.1 RNA polymerase sigma-70 factor [Actinoallomurus rhizosphaericola]